MRASAVLYRLMRIEAARPWRWVPSLYFAQAVPYVIAMTVSVVMYKTLGISNTDIALYTSWLYLPWVIKPLWSPIVEMLATKRIWIVAMQVAVGASLGLVALTLPMAHYFQLSLAALWLLAFASATHDIAADGFYMLALEPHRQASFVGVRSAFFRVGMVTAQGGLVFLAGSLGDFTGKVAFAWSIVFMVAGGLFIALCAWHQFALPRPAEDHAVAHENLLAGFASSFATFFRRPRIASILAFLLLFRFAEAQALKMATPFLLDPRSVGGLGLGTEEVGIVYGTIGVIALTAGGLLGGIAISRDGLRRWLWPMVVAMHVPNLVFVYLALVQPSSVATICAALALEQFGYGFGFAAFLLFMVMVSDGPTRTAHYAICTGFMALGMMLPGMASGWLQERLGYANFFVWVCFATIPSFLVAAWVHVDPDFGRRPRAR
jgi:MFS transporter, PAT family, beta-lactamase induction signal transducer AmpG